MAVTLQLSEEQATALQAKAAAEGLSLEAWIAKIAEPQLSATRPHRHIWEIIAENMKNVPDEDLAAMPKEGWCEPNRPLRLRRTQERALKAVFADTFYWAAITSTEDSAHERAMAFSRSFAPEQIVTTDEVLCEYPAFCAGAGPSVRAEAGQIVAGLIENLAVRVVPQSRESFRSGLQLYRARPDKGYSLTDCISMHTMRREGLTEVLTNDRYFEQEGFRALFR